MIQARLRLKPTKEFTRFEEGKKSERRVFLLAGVMLVFLYPLVLGEFGVNYSFVLLPIIYGVFYNGFAAPPAKVAAILIVYTIILIASLIYAPEVADGPLRRSVSYAIFVSAFSYSFINIQEWMVKAFRYSLMGFSVAGSLGAVYLLSRGGEASLGFEAKDLVGSQRIGFIYLMALSVAYHQKFEVKWPLVLKTSLVAVILCGLLLTFSRASIVTVMAVTTILGLAGISRWVRRPRLVGFLTFALMIVGAALAMLILWSFFPVIFDFFDARLFRFFSDRNAVYENLGSEESSEGTRVFLADSIMQYVRANPLTGSGYLGVWALLGNWSGSAHSQYTDILFRTGIFGFAVYTLILAWMGVVLFQRYRDLFWGYVAVLIYGLFHETFKESQGNFIFAFLFGLAMQSRLYAARMHFQSLSLPNQNRRP
jgi:O-antigen ligase